MRYQVAQHHGEFSPVYEDLYPCDWIVFGLGAGECAVEDPYGLADIASGVGLYDGVCQRLGQALHWRRFGGGGLVDDADPLHPSMNDSPES